jgi:hypothetical protein
MAETVKAILKRAVLAGTCVGVQDEIRSFAASNVHGMTVLKALYQLSEEFSDAGDEARCELCHEVMDGFWGHGIPDLGELFGVDSFKWPLTREDIMAWPE